MTIRSAFAEGSAAILAGALAGAALAAAVRRVRSGDRNGESDDELEGLTEIEFNRRNAVLYFRLRLNEDNFNEDVELVEDEPWRAEKLVPLLGTQSMRRSITGKVKPSKSARMDDRRARSASDQAIRALAGELPGVRIVSEGHDQFDDEILKISVSSLEELKAIRAKLIDLSTDGPDAIQVELYDHPYFEFGDFLFYPDGVNDERYDLLKVVILTGDDRSLRLMASEDEEWDR